jgi:large subunit ribosomal protein L6
MSRIGKQPVVVPQGVKVQIEGATIRADGPKGKLAQTVPPGLSATVAGGRILIEREGDDRRARSLHGLTRALVANMVQGVKDGFERRLEIVGIGYRAQMQGKVIQLALGYSHPVMFALPEGVTAEIDKQTAITLRGPDKAVLGQTAAKLRALRKPDPYKGKGVRYVDEYVRRKVGKKAGAAAK